MPAAARGEPVTLTGTTAEGAPLNTKELKGKVVVVNLWYAACGPCRAEAPALQAVATRSSEADVKVVGVNTRDEAETVQAFQRTFTLTYPTVVDRDGTAIAGLQGQLSPQAVPTTLILDRQGRVSARILGTAQPSTLRALVDSALAEK